MKISIKNLFTFIFVALFGLLIVACTVPEVEEFTVTFQSVGGSAVISQTVEAGELLEEPAPPTRDGFVFGGWFTEFALENEWDFEEDTVESNMTLYAKWTPEEAPVYFIVEFVGNGGPAPDNQEILSGGKVTKPTNPVRGGFVFTGWFMDAGTTQEWNFETDTVTANMTLYAGWDEVEISYNFVFNSNGGSNVATQSIAAGAKATKPADPTRSGYIFAGWFTTNQLTTAWNFDTMVVNGHKTVFAKWVEEVTVTFDALGGDVLPETLNVGMGSKITEPDALYAGHELQGWFKDSNFEQEFDFDTDVVNTDITLYAKWWLIPEGMAINSQDDLYHLLSGQTTYETGAKFYLRNDLDFTGFEWNGALFAEATLPAHSFNLNGNGKKVSNITFTGTNQAGLIPRMSGGSVFDLTLENIHVTGSSQGGILIGRIMNQSTVMISNVTVLNSSVTGGNAGVGGLIGHIQGATGKSTVTVNQLVMLGITVSNNNNGTGGVVGDIESSKLTLQDVLVEVVVSTTGERVGGLVGEARRNSSNANDLPELTVDNAIVKAELFGLRYLAGIVGRADNNMTNLDAGIHGATSLPVPGTISDVVLILNLDLTHASDTNSGHIARSNVGTPTNAYVIAFNYDRANLNGINVPNENIFADVNSIPASIFAGFSDVWTDAVEGQLPNLGDSSLEVGHKVTLHLGEQTKVQYVRDGRSLSPIYVADQAGSPFEAFFTDATLETLYEDTAITANLDLYAKFTPIYNVTFNSNGGSDVSAVGVREGETLTLPTAPTKAGFSFDGWFTDEALSSAFVDTTPITAELVLYAKWIDNVAPIASFETEPGEVVLPGNGQLVIKFMVSDPSGIQVIEFSMVDTYLLVADAVNPFADVESADAFALLGTISYDELTKVFTVTFSIDATEDLALLENVSFSLKAKDLLDNESVLINLVVSVDIVNINYTVSFEVNGGIAMDDYIAYDGEELTVSEPTKEGSVFDGWFTDAGFTSPFVQGTAVVGDLVLYAKWVAYVPVGTAITTTQELLDLFASGGSGNYYLANDLDFTDVAVVAGSASFSGILDGNFKTISNISATASANKTGVFFKILSGTVKNLTIQNSSYVPGGSGEASGFITGAAIGGALFDNLTFLNVTIDGSATTAGYNALLAGDNNGAQATDIITISNITVINDSNKLINSAKYAGGLFGYIRTVSVFNVSNIYMDAPVVSANLNEGSNEAQAAGMIFGRTNAAATINVEDVVLKGYIRASKNVGLIIGNGNSSAILSVTNMFVSDLEINSGSSAANLIYGNGIAPTNATLVNIHYVTESVTLTASGSLSQGTAVALANVTNEWLETNGYDTNLFEVVAGEVVRK